MFGGEIKLYLPVTLCSVLLLLHDARVITQARELNSKDYPCPAYSANKLEMFRGDIKILLLHPVTFCKR